MAPGNFFVNFGYMSFGQISSPFNFNSNFSYCNFQMPIFYNSFSFNFNPQNIFFQNTFTQPYFNTGYNFSYNIPAFNTSYNSNLNNSSSYSSTPISINDFYSFNSNSITNTPTTPTVRRSSSTSTTEARTETSSSKTTTRKTGLLREYNSEKGNRLADIAMHNAGYVIDASTTKITSQTKDPDEFTSYCARYVKAAIRDAGLGEYYSGHAYQMAGHLRNNDNFKEISSSTPLKDVPAGAILVYDRGVAGYSSQYGHVEIKTDDGRAVSDGITDNLYKRPSHIFIPV